MPKFTELKFTELHDLPITIVIGVLIKRGRRAPSSPIYQGALFTSPISSSQVWMAGRAAGCCAMALVLVAVQPADAAAATAASESTTAGKDCTPPRQLLWNSVCLPPASSESGHHGWPPNQQLNRSVASPPYLHSLKPAVINVSVGRQLFLDTFLTESSSGLRTIFHAPTYDTLNPVIQPDRPWDLSPSPYYGGFASAFSGGAWWNPLASPMRYELFYKCGSAYCVAYSNDSITWTKPELDNGFKTCAGTPCNVVLDVDYDGATVWLDLDTANASRRYILAGAGLVFYSSPNGTRFVKEGKSGPTQDRSSIYKDALRDRWVYSIKASGPKTSPGRTRRYWESEIGGDVVADAHWGSISAAAPVPRGDPVQWLDSDILDQPNLACNGNTQLYNFDAVAYESVIIGLFSIITGKRCVPPRPFKRGGEQDAVYLGFSRDGFSFQRSPVPSAYTRAAVSILLLRCRERVKP
jgi:hypothetical protein